MDIVCDINGGMNHQSRFKFYLVSPEQVVREAGAVQVFVQELQQFIALKKLSSAESVALFVLFYLQLRRPDEWGMSSGKTPSVPSQRGVALCDLPESFLFLKNLKSHFLLDLLVEYRPKHLPHSVFDVLWHWGQQEYDLLLVQKMPTPLEMLTYQARGQRVVTMDLAAAARGELVDGKRDAFEFLLHDLIHADLFFRDPDLFNQQKEFFSRLAEQIEKLKLLEQSDPLFLQDLYYLMADMNSHRAHLQAHWQAILVQWQLRKEGKASKDVLSSTGREWVQEMSTF